jgi:hypothetical protein
MRIRGLARRLPSRPPHDTGDDVLLSATRSPLGGSGHHVGILSREHRVEHCVLGLLDCGGCELDGVVGVSLGPLGLRFRDVGVVFSLLGVAVASVGEQRALRSVGGDRLPRAFDDVTRHQDPARAAVAYSVAYACAHVRRQLRVVPGLLRSRCPAGRARSVDRPDDPGLRHRVVGLVDLDRLSLLRVPVALQLVVELLVDAG